MTAEMHEAWIMYAVKGRTRRWRHVRPLRVWFGRIPHRKAEQWYLDAFDLETRVPRSFAMSEIHRWTEESPL